MLFRNSCRCFEFLRSTTHVKYRAKEKRFSSVVKSKASTVISTIVASVLTSFELASVKTTQNKSPTNAFTNKSIIFTHETVYCCCYSSIAAQRCMRYDLGPEDLLIECIVALATLSRYLSVWLVIFDFVSFLLLVSWIKIEQIRNAHSAQRENDNFFSVSFFSLRWMWNMKLEIKRCNNLSQTVIWAISMELWHALITNRWGANYVCLCICSHSIKLCFSM